MANRSGNCAVTCSSIGIDGGATNERTTGYSSGAISGQRAANTQHGICGLLAVTRLAVACFVMARRWVSNIWQLLRQEGGKL
ncbi:MAG: hypothetical protein DLM69_03420 [Candidatus Chloroheliales bacterium]|nr:MAG: hypothetical protein DLM69_03420 [Chloroflexota bacterium]